MGSNGAVPPEHEQSVSNLLSQRGATLPCPRCGDNNWNVLDAYISHPLTQEVEKVTIGGPILPTVGIICTRCGFLAEHATARLGLGRPI
jgi:hypothetical protein